MAQKTSTNKSVNAVPQAGADVLLRPMLSEKTTRLEGMRQYTFAVAPFATKVQVKQAVKAAYGVVPTRVNMSNTDGKLKRFGLRFGRRTAIKKAIVTLPKGKNIDIHAGV